MTLKEVLKQMKKDTGSGFQLIIQKLFDVLQKEGLNKILVNSGDEFDVNQHEAISQIPTKKTELKGKMLKKLNLDTHSMKK